MYRSGVVVIRVKCIYVPINQYSDLLFRYTLLSYMCFAKGTHGWITFSYISKRAIFSQDVRTCVRTPRHTYAHDGNIRTELAEL